MGARPQGGHARHLLRRDQPAVHGADRAARPRGDRAAVDDRRDGDDALPRRHPQHRFRGRLGRTAPAERRTGRSRPRPGMGLPSGSKKATRPARPTRPCTARRRTCWQKIKENSTYNPSVADPLDPVTFVNKINVPTFMACQWEDEQTGGPLCRSGPALHRHEHASGSRSPTAPTSTRSIRTRTTGCTTSWSCTSRTRRRSSTRRSCMPRPRSSTRKRWGFPKTTSSRFRRTRSSCSRPTNRRWPPSKRSRRSGCCSTTAQGHRRPASTTAGNPYPGFEQSFSEFPIPGTTARILVFRAGRHAQRTASRPPRASTPTPRMRMPRR